MRIFVDTSAFLAIIDRADRFHPMGLETWVRLLSEDIDLITSNYIVLETTALIQHRLGLEAVALFYQDILPVFHLEWISPNLHWRAVGALLGARRRGISLVDYTSFELMREIGIRTAFSFDRHFAEQGFAVLPASI
jgi:predicted nucleic acid-binding protein